MELKAIQQVKVGYMIDALNTLEKIETDLGKGNLENERPQIQAH